MTTAPGRFLDLILTTSLTCFLSPPAFAALRRGSFWSRVGTKRRRKERTCRRKISGWRKIVRLIQSHGIPKTRRMILLLPGGDLNRLGIGERNSAKPKARRAERAGARESMPG
jgi:hypothetical protein